VGTGAVNGVAPSQSGAAFFRRDSALFDGDVERVVTMLALGVLVCCCGSIVSGLLEVSTA
jgi:hypothetical protein